MKFYLIPDKTKGEKDYYVKSEKDMMDEQSTKCIPNTICVQTKFIRKADNRLYLRIWNSGYATAYNVRFFIPDERRICVLKSRAYYPYINPGKAFDEYVVADEDILSDVNVIILWEDERGNMFSNANKGYINKIHMC